MPIWRGELSSTPLGDLSKSPYILRSCDACIAATARTNSYIKPGLPARFYLRYALSRVDDLDRSSYIFSALDEIPRPITLLLMI